MREMKKYWVAVLGILIMLVACVLGIYLYNHHFKVVNTEYTPIQVQILSKYTTTDRRHARGNSRRRTNYMVKVLRNGTEYDFEVASAKYGKLVENAQVTIYLRVITYVDGRTVSVYQWVKGDKGYDLIGINLE